MSKLLHINLRLEIKQNDKNVFNSLNHTKNREPKKSFVKMQNFALKAQKHQQAFKRKFGHSLLLCKLT